MVSILCDKVVEHPLLMIAWNCHRFLQHWGRRFKQMEVKPVEINTDTDTEHRAQSTEHRAQSTETEHKEKTCERLPW